MSKRNRETRTQILLHLISYSTMIATISALLVFSLPSLANPNESKQSSEFIDKKIAGKILSTLHFERIEIDPKKVIEIDKGVVVIHSNQIDKQTVEKIKSISMQIEEVEEVITANTLF